MAKALLFHPTPEVLPPRVAFSCSPLSVESFRFPQLQQTVWASRLILDKRSLTLWAIPTQIKNHANARMESSPSAFPSWLFV